MFLKTTCDSNPQQWAWTKNSTLFRSLPLWTTESPWPAKGPYTAIRAGQWTVYPESSLVHPLRTVNILSRYQIEKTSASMQSSSMLSMNEGSTGLIQISPEEKNLFRAGSVADCDGSGKYARLYHLLKEISQMTFLCVLKVYFSFHSQLVWLDREVVFPGPSTRPLPCSCNRQQGLTSVPKAHL